MRPYLDKFLNDISKFYNVFIYSHGRTQYIKAIVDTIDPKKTVFNR